MIDNVALDLAARLRLQGGGGNRIAVAVNKRLPRAPGWR